MHRVVITVFALAIAVAVHVLADALTVHLQAMGLLTVAADRLLLGSLLHHLLCLHQVPKTFLGQHVVETVVWTHQQRIHIIQHFHLRAGLLSCLVV